MTNLRKMKETNISVANYNYEPLLELTPWPAVHAFLVDSSSRQFSTLPFHESFRDAKVTNMAECTWSLSTKRKRNLILTNSSQFNEIAIIPRNNENATCLDPRYAFDDTHTHTHTQSENDYSTPVMAPRCFRGGKTRGDSSDLPTIGSSTSTYTPIKSRNNKIPRRAIPGMKKLKSKRRGGVHAWRRGEDF